MESRHPTTNIQLSLSNMRGLSLVRIIISPSLPLSLLTDISLQACLVLLAGLVVSQETTETSSERESAETTTQTPTSTSTASSSTSTTSTTTTTTEAPVVIVKQVNEINEDGSYTVGYEASDGSFRLETKDAEGNVEGGDIF